MLKIGLTGGMGCGKSTVAELFSARGARILNADEMVHELLSSCEDIKKRIISEYGENIIGSKDGHIDRGKLALKCFKEKQALKPLLSIVYPELRRRVSHSMRFCFKQGANIVVFEAPVLLESGFESLFDRLVLVRASPDIQIKRLLKKGYAIEQIKARLNFQWPEWVKARYADFILDNSGDMNKTKEQFNRVFAQIVMKN